jgi:hypothetical protein
MPSSGNHNYFWLKRIHSLLGIMPIGAFVLEHFFSNSYVFQGAERFNKMVEDGAACPRCDIAREDQYVLLHRFRGRQPALRVAAAPLNRTPVAGHDHLRRFIDRWRTPTAAS